MSAPTPAKISDAPAEVNATRSYPLCKDCAHYRRSEGSVEEGLCDHPCTEVHVLTGLPTMPAKDMRLYWHCGHEGRLFDSAKLLRHKRRLAELSKEVEALGVSAPGFLRSGGVGGTPVKVYALNRGVWTSRQHGKLRVAEDVFQFDANGDKIFVDPLGAYEAYWLVTAVEDLVSAIGCELKAVRQEQFVELAHGGHGGNPPTAILSLPQGAGKTSIGEHMAARLGCTHVVDFWQPDMPVLPGALHLTESVVLQKDGSAS